MTSLLLAAVLALTPQASLSGSSDARTEADFRCYTAAIVMAGMAGEEDTEALNAASVLAFYYLGRLEGREPNADWITKGIHVGNAQPEQMLGELTRCGAEFEAKGREMVQKGEASQP
jgi:hypothetical protein